MSDPVRVLMLIDGFRMGGAERLFAALLPEIDTTRVTPVVCTLNERWDSEIADTLDTFNGARYTLNARRMFDPEALARLVRLIRKERIDVIHAQLTDSTVLGSLAGLLTGKPVMLTRHTLEQVELHPRARFRWWLELVFSRRVAKRVLAVSRAARRFLLDERHRPNRVHVVYNGIQLSDFGSHDPAILAARREEFGITPDDRVIVTVAVLRPGKGHEVLLQAMQQIREEVPQVKLLLVGDGPRGPELREQCIELGLQGTVIFAGQRNDVADLLPLGNVFVLPSFFEALPTVLFEAMVARLPVVATDVGGIPEIVRADETGLLVPPGEPEALAQAISRILTNDTLAQRFAEKGYQRAHARFSRARQARRTEAHYLALAGCPVEEEYPVHMVVVEPVGRGGLVQYAYQWCQALAEQGADVTMLTATDYELHNYPHDFDALPCIQLWDARPQREFATRGLRYRLDVLWRKIRRPLRGLRYIRAWLKIIASVTRTRPNVVQFGEITFAFEGLFLWYLKLRGFKLVDVAHNVRQFSEAYTATEVEQKRSWRQRWYGWIYNLFDAIFVHANYSRRLFLDLYPVSEERVHTVDLPAFQLFLRERDDNFDMRGHLNIPPDAPIVLFFGTLTPYKGVDLLLEAFPRVLNQRPAYLVVAGFPTKQMDLTALEQAIDSGGIRDYTRMDLRYLPMEQVPIYLETANVVVFPYRAIYQSGVLQVAYTFGRPVVATAVGGLLDVVEEGGTGYLVTPDDPEALAKGIVKMLDDPERAEAMGRRAYELAQTRFAWPTLACQVMAVYRELVIDE